MLHHNLKFLCQENEDVSHVGNGEECDPDPQFKPIITLPEVEVSLNEDHEVEMLKIRAKLYRFDSHSDPPEWKVNNCDTDQTGLC